MFLYYVGWASNGKIKAKVLLRKGNYVEMENDVVLDDGCGEGAAKDEEGRIEL